MAGFSQAIAIEHDDGDAESETFSLDLDPQWSVGGKPNGGYLLSVAANAGAYVLNEMGSAHLHPIASSAHYLKAPEIGPVTIAAELLRMGRSGSQVRATVSQNGEDCVEALINYATLPGIPAPWWSDGAAMALPPFETASSSAPSRPVSTSKSPSWRSSKNGSTLPAWASQPGRPPAWANFAAG